MMAMIGGGDGDYCRLGRVKSLSDMVFGFFEEREELLEDCWVDEGEEEEDESSVSAEEKSAFWKSQMNLLQVALSSKSSLETKVGRLTEDALRRIRSEGGRCLCSRNADGAECRNCIRRTISNELRRAGFDCGICKSKWKSSPDIPSGEHSYLDVVNGSTNNKRSPTRVVIELNFRAEFEMARASRDYNSLVSNLPEVFVGKPEKMKSVIKIVCAAAKRCMKDNKMHMGPWRKHKYMQAKWMTSSERVAVEPETRKIPLVDRSTSDGRRSNRPKASMLNFDLHRTGVEVV